MSSKRFGFVLLPEFALLPLSCMVDTLEDANYVSERRLYGWCSLSVEGTEVMAGNGLRVATDFGRERCNLRDRRCRLAAHIWLPADTEERPVGAVMEYIPYRRRDLSRMRDEPVGRA